jgi:benzoylformate decarboxylase
VTSVADRAEVLLQRLGLTTMFANPGSTEIPLLCRGGSAMRFILGLHEGSVVGAATGYALATGRPALALLHTTAGFGNAVGALATARENHAPLVVVVGQQDRRHLALRPFLAGELDGLAGSYPVYSTTPALARDVPGALARAHLEATSRRGPAVVVVPMDDWDAAADEETQAVAQRVVPALSLDAGALDELVSWIDRASAPALVVGADADAPDIWSALIELAEHLGCPVWQEPFGARAGFPQDHPQFAGHLPAGRQRLREAFRGNDLVLVVGAAAFRQYPYEPGPLVAPGTRVALALADADLAAHSVADLAVLGPLAPLCAALRERCVQRPPWVADVRTLPSAALLAGAALRPRQIFTALRAALAPEAVVVEECPSARPDLHRFLPARRPFGFLSAAMGGLGFAIPAAIGVRLARPDRPVVAVVGDGSSLYGIQALWTAAHYDIGVLVLVLRNGRYAVMDRLAEQRGRGPGPWPAFAEVSVATLAAGFGCPSVRVGTAEELERLIAEVVPELAGRRSPLLVEIDVTDESEFQP